VSGVGVKTAKLIALSLAGKISGGLASVSSGSGRASVDALIGLGYSEKEATLAVRKVSSPNLSDQDVLKLALQQLAKAGTK
jgi:Holliday junction DNA helicase RuvA